MKTLVFGSLNIDRTYHVPHFVTAGETLSACDMHLFRGGKGYNQAIACRRAGFPVSMAGAVGSDGDFLLEPLLREGVDVRHVKRTEGASGHAVIQVDPKGGNCILILAGANGEITEEDADRVLPDFGKGDLVILQNEISSLPYIIRKARETGMIVALNPSPISESLLQTDFRSIDYLVLNEVEGAALSGDASAAEGESPKDVSGDMERYYGILAMLRQKYPGTNLLLTLGKKGALFLRKGAAVKDAVRSGIYPLEAVDSTAAGDTFTGYFLGEYLSTGDARRALRRATIASGISVSRPGASPSIPTRAEVDELDAALDPDEDFL
ncbi:MAG: ribokinase [Lachnospiraceae bacterium]|nr:ribokinase [Lachnospiraceae bacterium]